MTRSSATTTAVAALAALAAISVTCATAAPAARTAPVTVQQATQAPAQAPLGGDTADGDLSKRGEDGAHHGRDHDEGWIHISGRTYYGRPGGCITVVSGPGAKSLDIHNESRGTVEVFRGVACGNGAPIAAVGPRSSITGVAPGPDRTVFVKNAVVGSFRVVDVYDGIL
ncbi:hypothetical protein H0H10_09245 [Streptomyces sp. TRM S81-3]|uniref:Lipoprotein n=1 Tax=Streptomyces griseicoloratus TaxID=2752516 RepID=A0A926L1F0_9ACTN|nr:hypothetical protein [Streptomyces griseicoloratus]MBD0419344.1 hypothetical protein [Streptomyces griseicoloratus]